MCGGGIESGHEAGVDGASWGVLYPRYRVNSQSVFILF